MWRLAGVAIVLSCAAQPAAAAPMPNSALAAAAFAAPPAHGEEALNGLMDHTRVGVDATASDWSSGEVRLSRRSTLRMTISEPAYGAGRPLRLPGVTDEAQAYEVSVIHDWPVSIETRSFGLDVAPHAGVGMTSAGGLAEAGATVRLSQKLDDAAVERLRALGVRDGASLGGQGRWYIFAAASGRAVGLNMLHNGAGWDRAGLTTDPTSTLVGDAQLGVGWRKGAMQTSLGLIHREVKNTHLLYGQETKADSVVAFSFSVRPRK